jgi:integrase
MAEQKQDTEQKEKRRGHGEGSWIYLDGLDKWKFRVSTKTPDGIAKRFAVTASTKTECRELAKSRAEQIGKGIGLNIDTKNITLKEYLKRWVVDYVDPRLSASTRRTYHSMINKQLAGKISDIPLKKLLRPAIQRHFNEMAKKGGSTATISLAHVVLHSALKQACEDRIIGGNPASGVKLQQVVNEERVVYSAAEVQKLLLSVADHPHRIGFNLLFSVALREGELIGLRWTNVDLQKNKIHVVEQLARGKGFTYGSLKTKKSKRVLPISPGLAVELKAHKTRQKEMLLKSGVIWTEEMPVISNIIGRAITHDAFYQEYVEVIKAAGLESTGTHDARHTCLTLLGNSGMDAKTLSRFAGHSNVAFTLNKYVKESDSVAVAGVNVLDTLIYSAK